MSTENEQLRQEIAALRAVLAAVRDLATVPLPANYFGEDLQRHYMLCATRIDCISTYANPDMTVGDGGPRSADLLHATAETVRELAARPLRYAPKAATPPAEPEPVVDPVEGEGSDLD